MEEIRIKKIQDRLERQRQLESTLKYKFQSMPKEDQWALIGGGVSIIVLIMLGKDHKTSIIYSCVSTVYSCCSPFNPLLTPKGQSSERNLPGTIVPRRAIFDAP